MSIKKLRNKERRSLKAVMQGGVVRGEKKKDKNEKLCETLPWKQQHTQTHAYALKHTHTYMHVNPKAHPVQSY